MASEIREEYDAEISRYLIINLNLLLSLILQ